MIQYKFKDGFWRVFELGLLLFGRKQERPEARRRQMERQKRQQIGVKVEGVRPQRHQNPHAVEKLQHARRHVQNQRRIRHHLRERAKPVPEAAKLAQDERAEPLQRAQLRVQHHLHQRGHQRARAAAAERLEVHRGGLRRRQLGDRVVRDLEPLQQLRVPRGVLHGEVPAGDGRGGEGEHELQQRLQRRAGLVARGNVESVEDDVVVLWVFSRRGIMRR